MAKRYQVKDLFDSVHDIHVQWRDKQDPKTEAELTTILVRCCAQFVKDNTPILTTVKFFFDDKKKELNEKHPDWKLPKPRSFYVEKWRDAVYENRVVSSEDEFINDCNDDPEGYGNFE